MRRIVRHLIYVLISTKCILLPNDYIQQLGLLLAQLNRHTLAGRLRIAAASQHTSDTPSVSST